MEKEIAAAEQNSPKMALEQKINQIETLKTKITEQEVTVEALEQAT